MPSTAALTIALVCGVLTAGWLRGQERAAPVVRGTGLIVGRIVDSTGGPVAGARVRLHGPAGWLVSADNELVLRELIASREGEFYFAGLPPGEYGIRAERAGYDEGFYGRRQPGGQIGVLALEEGERRVDVRITMWKHAVVTGIVTDDSGEPLQGAVRLYRRTVVAGHPRFEPVGGKGGLIDDRGRYRLYDVPGGTYILVYAGWSDGPLFTSSDADELRARRYVYPPTCYAAAAGGELAIVPLSAGQEMRDIDFRVAPVSGVRVAGVVHGIGPGRANLRLVPEQSSASPCQPREHARSVSAGNGTFAFEPVQPGRYELQITERPTPEADPSPRPQTIIQTPAGTITGFGVLPASTTPALTSEPARWASLPVVIRTTDLDDITLTMQQGPRVSGRMEFDVSPSPPEPDEIRRRAHFRFERADGQASWGSHPQVAIAGGRFAISGVLPGRYAIHGGYDSWSLRSVAVGGRDVTDVPFEIGRSDVDDLVLVFTDRTTTISGVVSSDGSDADMPGQVLIFPADPRLWVDYGSGIPRQRMVRVGTSIGNGGNYSTSVLPGDYFVVATSSDVGDNWTDPEYLKRLTVGAERVSLGEGDRITLNLRSRPIP